MAAKEPTNAELLKELKEFGQRLLILEDWKRNEDAYRAALAKVKSEEKENKQSEQSDEMIKRRTEIMKQVGIVLALLIAILYAYASSRGIATP